MSKQYYVYIMTNKHNTTLYTGVTNNLIRRVKEHRDQKTDSFTKRYNLNKLVYYAIGEDAYSAISWEKKIKAGSRDDKIALINKTNPEWNDLWDDISGEHVTNDIDIPEEYKKVNKSLSLRGSPKS